MKTSFRADILSNPEVVFEFSKKETRSGSMYSDMDHTRSTKSLKIMSGNITLTCLKRKNKSESLLVF